ncbi:MAG: hypothetical protein PHX61_03815 [Alphaproteobacteria bacterium]|nr:hypothetical protein [Alphaproteobacteria bacterium]
MARVFSISRNEDQSLACRMTTPEFEQNKAVICNASVSPPAADRTMGIDAPSPSMT